MTTSRRAHHGSAFGEMPRLRPSCLIALVLVCAGPACASQGSFEGRRLGRPDASTALPDAVPFVWNSSDGGRTGELAVSLPDGAAFAGTFVSDVQAEAEPQPIAWYAEWRAVWGDDAPVPDPGAQVPDDSFSDAMVGRALARLNGTQDKTMRCSFLFDQPLAGLKGGARGRCVVSDGTTIDASFVAPVAHHRNDLHKERPHA